LDTPSLEIEFANIEHFVMTFDNNLADSSAVPYWAKFEHMTCVGNQKHGSSDMNYCSLGVEIERLVKYFSKITSIEKGTIRVHYSDNTSLSMHDDAQTIFYNAIWFILLHSQCSIFKNTRWLRSNYLLTCDPEKMFYVFFSAFITKESILTPNSPPDLNKFKTQMDTMHQVLVGLLTRIKSGINLPADSVSNGFVKLDNQVLLFEMELTNFYQQLKDKIAAP